MARYNLGDEYLAIHAEVVKLTPKALLLRHNFSDSGHSETWVPRSQVEDGFDYQHPQPAEAICIKKWFCDKENIQ